MEKIRYTEMIRAIEFISNYCLNCDTCNECKLYSLKEKHCKLNVFIPKHWDSLLLDDLLQIIKEERID